MEKQPEITRDGRKTILMLSWRDIDAPKAGGAELYTHKMLAGNADVFQILHFSPLFPGARPREVKDGVTYIRAGNIFSVIFKARQFYRQNSEAIDYVIDQANTHRFFTRFWVPAAKRIFLIFQLTREIWDYHLPFPFSKLGRLLETPMLRLNRHDPTITISRSTKEDLVAVGFDAARISVIYVGLDVPVTPPEQWAEKEKTPTFIYIGRYARYKGIDVAIKALALLRQKVPNTRLWVLGKRDDAYIGKVLQPLCDESGLQTGHTEDADVAFMGFVDEDVKYGMVGRAHALLFPSVREGWGIIVTEAAAMGTPSVVFDTPGCRDAVERGQAGYLCGENTPEGLARQMLLVAEGGEGYQRQRLAANRFAENLTWERTAAEFRDFMQALEQ